MISDYYNSHHQKLTNRISLALQHHQQAILIDVHSYPKVASPYERDQLQNRPEICIGTCEYHTPNELEKVLVTSFKNQGFKVGLNTPFAGTLIPSKYWRKDKRVVGFMIEIRRDLYMNEASFRLSGDSNAVSNKICNAIYEALNIFLS